MNSDEEEEQMFVERFEEEISTCELELVLFSCYCFKLFSLAVPLAFSGGFTCARTWLSFNMTFSL
jgi:hypothetical protein